MNRLDISPSRSRIKSVHKGANRFLRIFWINSLWTLSPNEYAQWLDFYNANQKVQFSCLMNFETPQWKDYLCTFNGRYKADLVEKLYTVVCPVIAEEVHF